jgi:2-polyprenyl-3-methyl-5-hydroxy-6-metoxy-1,4-benzoquinol methylase
VKHANLFLTGDVSIGYIDSTALNDVDSQSFRLAESAHTDLISAVYEGGFKIWECTKDLADYLSGEESTNHMVDKRVLDLGCGAGILGLLCLKQNGRHVEFQDYNEEVLQHVTMVNVCLNMNDDEDCAIAEKVTFHSGDWASYAELTKDDAKFDVILTSETIYNAENYEKLVEVFEKRLTDDGCVFLAAKTYYFGVGGGTRQFEAYLQSRKNFKSEVVWKNSDGVAREILKISKC